MPDAQHILSEVLNKILDEKRYRPREVNIKPTTTDCTNYTTSLFLINASSPDRDDLKLFAKVACLGDKLRADLNATWMFETEIFVYTHLVIAYDDIQRKQNVPDEYKYTFPKFYGCNPEVGQETVVMENLIEAGFKAYNRFASVDWEHASAAVENIARFHALSFAFAKYYPEEFGRLTRNLEFQVVRMGEGQPSEATTAIRKRMVNYAIGLINAEQRAQVQAFLSKNQLQDKFNKPLGMPVIAHGDFRMCNMLFRRQGDSLQSIAVDYQTVHAGCPVSDLIYFIFTGSDEEFRRQHYERLLDHYYSSLVQALERLAVDPSVYTREKFDSDMKEMLPYAILLGVVVLPVVTVQADAAPSVQGDADVSDFVMAPNELYAQRFRGITNDCVRWGAI